MPPPTKRGTDGMRPSGPDAVRSEGEAEWPPLPNGWLSMKMGSLQDKEAAAAGGPPVRSRARRAVSRADRQPSPAAAAACPETG